MTEKKICSRCTAIMDNVCDQCGSRVNVCKYCGNVSADFALDDKKDSISGTACQMCKSHNTVAIGKTGKVQPWFILLAVIFFITTLANLNEGAFNDAGSSFLITALFTFFGVIAKCNKKWELICMDCSRRFRV